MTLANCIRYQKNINFWANFFLVAAIFCAASFLIDSEISLLIGIIGTILSVTIWLSLLLFKKYYQLYEKVFIAFQDLPPLASWTIAAADWESYQLVEKETRKRGYLKYILWSPVIMALIALSIYGEIDELDFDVNLIWYSLIGYAFLMLILYIQMRVGLNKTSHTGDHVIKLKTVGAQIDDSITYWGKFVADEHSTLGQALKSLLFAKSDKESKVNKAYLHQEGSYQYVVINFSLSEDHSSDLYLPITEEASTAIKEKLPQLQSAYLFNGEKQ